MPILRTVYGVFKRLQLKVKERKSLWESRFTVENPYRWISSTMVA